MLMWARVFVFLVFSMLGATFLATTGILAWEFKAHWLDFAALDSHLFVFFPTLGIVALIAFFVPSVLLTDLYWRHISFGKARFLFGFFVLAAASYWISGYLLDSPRRSYWEGAPQVVAADRGEPAGCAERGEPCQRLPMLMAVRNLRLVSNDRLGLEGLIRDCSASSKDPLIQPALTPERRRFCLASTPLSSSPPLEADEDCCKAQTRLVSAARANYITASTRSITSEVHAILLPLKVFFILVVYVISILLAMHHKKVERNYGAYLGQMEIGLFTGALCVLFFPLMSQAFLQSSEVLSGTAGGGSFSAIVPAISLLSMVWVTAHRPFLLPARFRRQARYYRPLLWHSRQQYRHHQIQSAGDDFCADARRWRQRGGPPEPCRWLRVRHGAHVGSHGRLPPAKGKVLVALDGRYKARPWNLPPHVPPHGKPSADRQGQVAALLGLDALFACLAPYIPRAGAIGGLAIDALGEPRAVRQANAGKSGAPGNRGEGHGQKRGNH